MMSFRLPSLPSLPGGRAPRPPSPRPPRAPQGLRVTGETLRGWTDPPPQWPGSDLEWILCEQLVRRGWKIYGRPRVKGFTLNHDEADAEWQPAIPVAGLNETKDFFRADILVIPGRKGPAPGPPYSRGIILDPVTDWTHRNAGKDRLRRGLLAQAGYLLVWLDGEALKRRPKALVDAALRGADDSSIDRGLR